MPQAPDTYQPPTADNADVEQYNSGKEQGQQGGDGLYQSYRYIKFRERQIKKQRTEDLDRVDEIYQGLESRSFSDYIHWYQQDMPLCVDCLEEGMIKPGRVMDHIEPIEKGGSIFDPDNLAFRCDHHHNIKRATEDRK